MNSEKALREAAQSVIDNASGSYRSRGKDRYIEDSSGERMMLVPHEDWHNLQSALAKPLPAPVEREGEIEDRARKFLQAAYVQEHGFIGDDYWSRPTICLNWQDRVAICAISAALAPETVREDGLRLAADTLDWIVEAWVHSKPWSDEQGKRATAVLMKLNAVLEPLSAREGE